MSELSRVMDKWAAEPAREERDRIAADWLRADEWNLQEAANHVSSVVLTLEEKFHTYTDGLAMVLREARHLAAALAALAAALAADRGPCSELGHLWDVGDDCYACGINKEET